jgi:hypothetical protein
VQVLTSRDLESEPRLESYLLNFLLKSNHHRANVLAAWIAWSCCPSVWIPCDLLIISVTQEAKAVKEATAGDDLSSLLQNWANPGQRRAVEERGDFDLAGWLNVG